MLYGYLCRLLNIYFFWESKTIGWTLFWVVIIFMLRDSLKKKKAVPEKIGIGICIFILLLRGVMFFVIPQTEVYTEAEKFIRRDGEITQKTGEVKSIMLIPYGGIGMTTGRNGSAGEADLHFIVKGGKKFIDLHLYMSKTFETEWKITIMKESFLFVPDRKGILHQ